MNSNGTDPAKPAPTSSRGAVPWRIALIVIATACVLKFAWVLRSGSDFCDLRTPLYASRVLLRGQDPYDDVRIKRLWVDDTGLTREKIQSLPTADIPGLPQFPLLYFPFYLGGLCAISLFSFKIASVCFLCVSMACLGGALALTWRRMSANGSGPIMFAMLLVLMILGEPATEALMKGQPAAIVALALLVVALQAGSPALQVVAIIVATIKPALCPVFVLWWLFREDVTARMKTLMVLLAISVQLVPLMMAGQSPYSAAESYLAVFDFAFAPDGVNSMANPVATYNVTTVDALMLRLFPAMPSAAVWPVKLALIGALAALTLRFLRGNRTLCLMNLLCLQYLMFYQRRYDLVLLALVGMWAISELAASDVRRYAILAVLAALAIPHFWHGASFVQDSSRAVQASIVSADIWLLLLLPVVNVIPALRPLPRPASPR
jgi:hypothetical protein